MALRKKFIEIELPLIDETVSVMGDDETLKGKTIKIDMARKLRGRGLEIVFKILENKKLVGVPKKLSLMKGYIRRMMRKRVNYVEDSFKTEAKDVKVIIKPFLITRKKVSRAVRNNLRNTAREFLIDYAKEKTFFELCGELLTSELQKKLQPKLKKVYPLSFCDIRIFEIAKSSDLDSMKIKFPEKIEKEKKEENEIQEEGERAEEAEQEAEEAEQEEDAEATSDEVELQEENKEEAE